MVPVQQGFDGTELTMIRLRRHFAAKVQFRQCLHLAVA
jgi:hypothetical protein